jgi:hypothetical protein
VLAALDVRPIKRFLLLGLLDPDEAVRLETARVLARSHIEEATGTLAANLTVSSNDGAPCPPTDGRSSGGRSSTRSRLSANEGWLTRRA